MLSQSHYQKVPKNYNNKKHRKKTKNKTNKKPLNGSREEWVAGLGCYAGERKKEGRIKERGDFAKGSSINLIKYQECLKTPKGTKKAVERNQTRQKVQ